MRLYKLVVIPLLALSSSALAQDAPPVLNPGEVLLQVQADGEFRSRPDVMEITAGVTTTGETAAAALTGNNEKADGMLKAVRSLGIAARDVQTSELSVRPILSKEEDAGRVAQPPVILGFVATNNVEIKLRDLGRAGAIISALFSASANSVRGPEFSLFDPKPAQRQARFNAVANAREEAETYAQAFGMKIARVIRSSERGDFRSDDYRNIIVTGTRIGPTPIEPGDVTTTITLWVDYALVPK